MLMRQLFDHTSSTYTYLLADMATREAVLIDPVREQVERDLALLAELDLNLVAVLETHVHADHVTAAGLLRERTGAMTASSAIGAPCVDRHLREDDEIAFGHHRLVAIETPGHTDDSLSFYFAGAPGLPAAVFTGDTLLIRGCGRTDFQNGDAGQLFDSVTKKLFTLPEETLVYPGHDYKGFTVSSIGEEKALNKRLANRGRDAFIALMEGLGLPRPRLIDEAVPANRACGNTPVAMSA
jgi:sulfur dioxygenase